MGTPRPPRIWLTTSTAEVRRWRARSASGPGTAAVAAVVPAVPPVVLSAVLTVCTPFPRRPRALRRHGRSSCAAPRRTPGAAGCSGGRARCRPRLDRALEHRAGPGGERLDPPLPLQREEAPRDEGILGDRQALAGRRAVGGGTGSWLVCGREGSHRRSVPVLTDVRNRENLRAARPGSEQRLRQHPFEGQQRPFGLQAAAEPAESAVALHHPVAGHHHGQRIRPHRRADACAAPGCPTRPARSP